MKNKLLPAQLTIQKNYLWDTINICWNDVQIMKYEDQINMPCTVTIPLAHKIKTHKIMKRNFDIQVTIKRENDF